MRKIFTFLLIAFVCSLLYADNQSLQKAKTGIDKKYIKKTNIEIIDSLEKELKVVNNDTNKVNLLCDLAYYTSDTTPDECLKLGEQAQLLSEKLNWQNGIAKSLRIIGIGYSTKKQNNKALISLNRGLKLGEDLEDKKIISETLCNIGVVYFDTFDYIKAQEYFEKSLKISEEINNIRYINTNLFNLGNTNFGLSNFNTAIDYYKKALKYVEDIDDKPKICSYLGNLGNAYQSLSDYNNSMECLEKAYNLAIELNDKAEICKKLNNLGNLFVYFANYPKGLEYYEKALKISEEIKDMRSVGINLGNIGNTYLLLGEYQKALEYSQSALKVTEEVSGRRSTGLWNVNIGNAYRNIGNYQKALEYLEKALKIAQENGRKHRVGEWLGNIGEVYLNLSNYPKALEYFEKATRIGDEIGNKSVQYLNQKNFGNVFLSIAIDTLNKANDSSKKENLNLALKITKTALEGYISIKEFNEQRQCEEQLSKIFEAIGDYKSALFYFKKSELLKDSIFSLENRKKIANLESQKQIELKNKEIALQSKENEILKQKNLNQNLEIDKQKQEVSLLNSKQALQKVEIEKRNAEVSLLQKNKAIAELAIKAKESEAKNKANEIKILQADKKEKEVEIKTKSLQLYVALLSVFTLTLVAFIVYKERKKSEELLLNVLPAIIAKRLKNREHPIADHFEEASIVFIDIVGFTKSSAELDPKRVAEILNILFTKLDKIAQKWGLEKIKTIGDCYMAAAGVPIADPHNAEKAAYFATEAMSMLRDYDTGEGTIIRFRCGIDCGPLVAGVIGEHKFIYDVWGDTVNMAARMEQNGEPDKVHTTERFKNKILNLTYPIGVTEGQKKSFFFIERGEMEIKGKGLMKTYFLK